MKSLKFVYLLSTLALSGVAVGATFDDVPTLIESGQLDEASALLRDSKEPSRFLWQGRIAFLNYDFDEAQRLYGQYRKAVGKGTEDPETARFTRQLNLADRALESVAKIEVIDSLAVPSASFLSAYRLPGSAGRLEEPDRIPVSGREDIASSVFFNERGDFALWAEPDSTGVYRITESTRLVDGRWSEPHRASELLNNGGDADYPFMCADGTTLYYSADGDDSIGGFDIYLATRDASDGSYLKPRNLGMPFNSPFDDFMMVIDEENGVGWWATDRNLLGDKLTIYVYKLTDSRENIDTEDENLISLAALSDISLTRAEGEDYTSLKRRIYSVQAERPRKPEDFRFYMPGRGMLTAYADLRTAEGRTLMKQYQDAVKKADADAVKLRELRRKYSEAVGPGGRSALAKDILALEKQEDATRRTLKNLKNDLIKKEGSSR